VIGDHINQKSRAFEVMSPLFESFKNHEELFVVDVIVEFRESQDANGSDSVTWN